MLDKTLQRKPHARARARGLGVEKYISNDDIKKAKELIVKTILEK
jgi:hypothetical protein